MAIRPAVLQGQTQIQLLWSLIVKCCLWLQRSPNWKKKKYEVTRRKEWKREKKQWQTGVRGGAREDESLGLCWRLCWRGLTCPLALFLLIPKMLLNNLANMQHTGVAVRFPLAVLWPIRWHDGYLVHHNYILSLPRHIIDRLSYGQEKANAVVGHASRDGSRQALPLVNVLFCPRVELQWINKTAQVAHTS